MRRNQAWLLRAGRGAYEHCDRPVLWQRASCLAVEPGVSPVTGEIARKVIGSFHRAKAAAPPQGKLTAREEEILDHLAKGYVTKEIADQLAVSPATLRFHLPHIYDKLYARSRVEAVAKYLG